MLDDDRKLKQRFYNKRVNARSEGIGFELTYEQFCSLLEEAGVVSSQLGIKGYHLSRVEDTGPYAVGNCRFLHYLDNLKEKKISDRVRENGRGQIEKMIPLSSQEMSEAILGSIKFQAYSKRRAEEAKSKRACLNQSYTGDHNSQYGTCWIYNTISLENRKIKKSELDQWLKAGWVKGRKISN